MLEITAKIIGEEANRTRKTALWLFDNPDAVGYLYNPDAAGVGLDPWTLITGVDASRDGSVIYLDFEPNIEREVSPEHVVWVQNTKMPLKPVEGQEKEENVVFDMCLNAMSALSDDDRFSIMSKFCQYCGSKDPRCGCWNDS